MRCDVGSPISLQSSSWLTSVENLALGNCFSDLAAFGRALKQCWWHFKMLNFM